MAGLLKEKLTRLYVVGKEVTFDTELAEGEEPITVWVQKLNPIQKEAVVRRANGKRQSVLTLKKRGIIDDEVQPFINEVTNNFAERDMMIEFLEAEKVNEIRAKAEEELSHLPEWEEEDYLQGLRDSWEDSLQRTWLIDNEDPEARRVYDELTRFSEQVEEKIASQRRQIHEDYDDMDDEEIVKRLVDKAIEVQADLRWVEVLRRSEIQYAVRDPEDHTKLIFDAYEDIEELQSETFEALYQAYTDLNVEPREGKD